MRLRFLHWVFCWSVLAAPLNCAYFMSTAHLLACPKQEQVNDARNAIVKLPMNWKKGDQRSYRITNLNAKLRPNGEIERSTTVEKITINVYEEDSESIAVMWTMGARKSQNPQINQEPTVQEINRIFNGFVMHIEVGEGWLFTRNQKLGRSC